MIPGVKIKISLHSHLHLQVLQGFHCSDCCEMQNLILLNSCDFYYDNNVAGHVHFRGC